MPVGVLARSHWPPELFRSPGGHQDGLKLRLPKVIIGASEINKIAYSALGPARGYYQGVFWTTVKIGWASRWCTG